MKLGSAAFALLLGFGVTTVVACSDSEEEARQAAAKAEADEQDAFLDRYCQIILPCCNTILLTDKNDVAGCKTRLRALDPVTVASKEGRTACITEVLAANPSPKFCPDFAHAKTPACPDASRKELVGTKALGEVCATNAECAPDFSGIVRCNGVCQVRKRGAAGDGPCDTTIDGDVTITSANEATGPTVYTCYLAADGLQCNPETNSCEEPTGDRKECSQSGECLKTHFCAEDEKRCFTRLGVDQKCDIDAECKGRCVDGFCTDTVQANEECTDTRQCADGLVCETGICTEPGPDARLAASCQ
ncbi:MAG: hypothetical protein KIT84_34895 [Labilithrix sp.]|nr:hypothetical protein [Labilithrix sp.]MCW5816238.1 hypothetical protein [Labilithrix sp.]